MKTPKTKKLMYFAAVYAAPEGGYTTVLADFPAYDQGETMEEAIAETEEFLQGIVDQYSKATGKKLPKPSAIEEFKAKLDPADGVPVCIAPVFAFPHAPAARIQLTTKVNFLSMIDDYARRHHMTRSDLMITSTLEFIRANP